MNPALYGDWAMMPGALPPMNADHMMGVRVLLDSKKRPEFVEIQWRTADEAGSYQTVRMDWINAIALLSFLKCVQLDSGQPFPLDPRNPNWKAGEGKP